MPTVKQATEWMLQGNKADDTIAYQYYTKELIAEYAGVSPSEISDDFMDKAQCYLNEVLEDFLSDITIELETV